ncbi:MAG: DUF1844 domain-containing protein [Chlorobi bacterium]|nr:DUF1844 domain-containing protein [Chlorobiota bacterium]
MSRRPDLRDVAALFVHDALIALGEVPNPLTNECQTDLERARTAIELLEVIEERTRPGRSDEEEHFLLQALTQLRLGYIRARENRTTAQSPPSPDNRT